MPNQEENESKKHPALERVSQTLPHEMPFLAARVTAEWESRRSQRRLFRWKMLAVGMSAFCVLLLVFPYQSGLQKKVAQILKSSGTTDIARAALDIPELSFIFSPRGGRLETLAGRPVVVRMALEEDDDPKIAQARILLPSGVEFFSSRDSKLSTHREVTVALTRKTEGDATFPFVIKAPVPGYRDVDVQFLGADGELILKRTLSINFVRFQKK